MKKFAESLKNVLHYPILCAFAVFMAFIFCMDMTSTNRSFSDMENRVLKQRPAFTVQSLVANEYTMKYEEYVNDQFIWRDQWITLKSVSESALQKIENNGVAYGRDHYLFEKYTHVDRDQLKKNIGFVQDFVSQHPDQHVTLAVVPNSYAILQDKTPAHFVNVPQQPLIDQVYSSLQGENLSRLDLVSALQGHSGEYIYYRTDHHWTTLGAYYAYADYAASRGLTPAPMAQLAPLAAQVPGFYGTYYSKAKLYSAQPDTITWYNLPVSSVEIDGKSCEGMYDLSKFAVRDKYAAFLWGNHGVTKIATGKTSGKDGQPTRVLVIKDSYGNSFAPFLTQSYDEVWVVDLRHVLKLSTVLQQGRFDDVLILYNYMNFAQDTNFARLRY